ncbi:hypothetical protein ACJX0J_038656, partial [Zea mays]
MTNSASPDPRARTQPRLRKTMDSASPDPRARTQPRPRRNRHLAQTRVRTGHVARGAIITLPLASSGYGGQDRCPIWLAPVNNYPMVDLTQLFMTATQEGKRLESQGHILRV